MSEGARPAVRGLPSGVEGIQRRTAAFSRATLDAQARTVELAFSSEAPVERFWGVEILGHDAAEVETDFISSGTAPLLMDHNARDVVGVVETVTLSPDRKMRARVRFGKSARAEEVMQDVADGIRANVSVGYELLDLSLISEERGKPPVYRCRWRPVEVSLVAIPADPTVGVGRSSAAPLSAQTGRKMDISGAASGRDAAAIAELAELVGRPDWGTEAIRSGWSLEQSRREFIARRGEARPLSLPPTNIGLDEGMTRELRRYSLVRVLRALADPQHMREAGFELEVSRELQRQHGDRSGFMVPLALPPQAERMGGDGRVVVSVGGRALTYSNSGNGVLVQTDVLASDFIDLIRARSYVMALGARTLTGLVGNVVVPRQGGTASIGWIAGDGSDSLPTSDPAFSGVAMSPKTAGAITTFSHRLMVQSSMDIESLVRADLAAAVAAEIDRVAVNGTGAGNQPRGVLQAVGIGAATFPTGQSPDFTKILALETLADGADMEARAYLTSPTMRGRYKATPVTTGVAPMIWTTPDNGALPGEGRMNGYRALATTQVPTQTTIFGNWSDLMVGMWGAIALDVDRGGANFATGSISVRVMQDIDVALRNAGSFAALTAV
ncbi:phage major capsid protein [Roseomonas sp. GC11]|uniref:phage major capsid protein n=1 Tax=Roseomonas sp. GC11 TaxID=2950546 RepID=UPI00210C6C04|nr:phage major capsid protein [Roseomonas sp. GC11]MCQ4162815.1 phage major capsid protein [Roseomonas sp. GC11]